MFWFCIALLGTGRILREWKYQLLIPGVERMVSNGIYFHWRVIDNEDKGYITIWQKLYFKNCNKVSYFYYNVLLWIWTSKVLLEVRNWPVNAGDRRDVGSIHGLGRSPGGGNGNPLQYSCLENPMDKGVWQAADHEDCSPWGRK